MNKRLALLSLLLLPLLACTRQEPAAPDASASPPAAEAPATAAPAEAATPTDDASAPGAEAAPASAGDAPAAATTDAASDATPAPAPATTPTPAPQGPPLVAGVDYEVVPNGQPFAPLDGKIEVVEVFNYVCPACAAFQPLVSAWKKKLPADVRFTYVPAPFGPRWDPYVRAYYTAETMGVAERAHDALFNAIHVEKVLKGELGQDSPEDIANFYARYGVDPKQFASTMASFAIDGRYNRARQFIQREQVNSTPTLIVNGKYKAKGKSFPDMLRITDQLIAMERAAAGG